MICFRESPPKPNGPGVWSEASSILALTALRPPGWIPRDFLAGAILTKMDGDSRGGAALSMKSVSGRPVKYICTGERMEMIEPFYPDRIASRILGMKPNFDAFLADC